MPDFFRQPLLLVAIVLLVILVIAPLASAILARRSVRVDASAKHARYARGMLILWITTAAALYALRLRGQSAANVGFVPPNDPAAAYAIALVFVIIMGFIAAGRTTIDPDYAKRIARLIPTTAADWWWFVPVALTAGICEEFLYRGYALFVLASMTHSIALGVVLSTAAFGLAHAYQGRRGIAGTTLFGLFLALVVAVWGSLWPCMLAHVLQDLIGGVILSRKVSALAASEQSEAASGDAPSAL